MIFPSLIAAVRLERDPDPTVEPNESVHADGFESGDTDVW